MAETNARGTNFSVLFKERYGDLRNLIPRQYKCQDDFAFGTSKADGDFFIETVMLRHEHGVTYAAPTDDAFSLEAPIAGEAYETKVQGAQHVIRAKIGINAVQSSKTSEQAFKNIFDVVVGNCTDSLRKRIEIDLLYGQQSLGTVASVSGSVVTITTADFAPGIWAGLEGGVVEFWDETGSLPNATERTSADGTITAVDLQARTITVTTPTGITAGDHILFPTQWNGSAYKTMLGMHTLSNISTTIFGLATSTSALFAPSTYGVGSGELTFGKVNKASVRLIAKGYEGDFCVRVNPSTYADLLDQEVDKRQWTKMGGRIDVGASEIRFHVAAGTITFKPSIYVREGYAYMHPMEGNGAYRRIGTTDVTTRPLGGRGESFLERISGVAAYEMLMYSKQALYTPNPGQTLALTGIVNGS